MAADDPSAGDRQRDGLTYAAAGVDVHKGDRFAAALRSHMRSTHGPRVIANEGGFAGLLRLDYNEALFKRNYKDPVLVACTDGVGTKVKLAAALGAWEAVGVDLVAMNVNDLVVQGAEPLMFLDYIATSRLDPAAMERVVAGVADACRSCGCALLGGETAEMPGVYPDGEIDLAGFAVGVVELSRATDTGRVEPGDVVIGLESDGVHSNGFSLVRAVIDHARLDLRTTYQGLDPERTLGDMLMRPTRVYAGPLVRVFRNYKVKRVISGMAHITGGGLADNLARALHPEVDARIDRTAWTPDPVFPFLQARGDIADDEMDRAFNMGVGFCLLVRPTFADSIAAQLEKLGERPRVIGEVVPGSGSVVVR